MEDAKIDDNSNNSEEEDEEEKETLRVEFTEQKKTDPENYESVIDFRWLDILGIDIP